MDTVHTDLDVAAPGGGAAASMSSFAAESSRRVDAEARAIAAELKTANLNSALDELRADAEATVESTQHTADAERAMLFEEAELTAVRDQLRAEVLAANEKAARLQRALHALTGSE